MKLALRLLFGFILLALIGVGSFVWFDRTKVENVILNSFIEKIRPSLPFNIVSYHLNRNLDSFEIHLLWNEIPISLLGPLRVQVFGKEGLSIEYRPILQMGGASPLSLELKSEVSTKLQLVDGVHLKAPPQDFQWAAYAIDFKNFSLNLEADKSDLDASAQAKNFSWTESRHSDHAINLYQLDLKLKVPDLHFPTQGTLALTAESGEVLWGKLYADLKLSPLPLRINSLDPEVIKLVLGKKRELEAEIKPVQVGKKLRSAKIAFKFRPPGLPTFLPWLIKTAAPVASSLQAWKDLEIKSGQGSVSGNLSYDTTLAKVSLRQLNSDLRNVSLRSVSHHFSARDLSSSLHYRTQEIHHHLLIQAGELFYKHFAGSLGKTDFVWTNDAFRFAGPLLLNVKNVPAKLSAVEGSLNPKFNLEAQLKIEPTDLQVLANGFCMPSTKLPPAKVRVDFPKLELSSQRIDPSGSLVVDLFKGKIQVDDIGYYDLDTEVPELDFDATWSGIDLQAMSDWSKFGEIQGTLEGYAHQVVFQSTLPTHYQFLLQVMPLDRVHDNARVDFSPEAMKNVVKVFTGTSLDEQMPGIAGWLMFGWPSHVFGGYDVNYAGIKLTSEEGRIVVETLDKPSIFARERKHYVLYGRRFKMPLRNPNYPLLIDATSMSNFVHQLMLQLNSIKKNKEGNKEDEDAPIICDPPQL